MNKLFRCFSQKFPYIYRTTSYHKAINSFPLSFSSHKTERDSDLVLAPEDDEFIGVKKIYEIFVNSLVSQDLSELNTLVEHNLLYRTREALKALEENGYKIVLRGSLDSFEIIDIKSTLYSGSILPQRNLNYPSEFYNITKVGLDSDDYIYTFKTLLDSTVDWHKFKDLDLDSINESDNISEYKEAIAEILSGMNACPILNTTVDYGIFTNYKLIILDKQGKVIAGNDSDDSEFHTIRIEEFSYKDIFINFLFPKQKAGRAFFTEKLGNYMNQFTLVDVDGFMKGNLIIPQY